jgi:hypothetical protein
LKNTKRKRRNQKVPGWLVAITYVTVTTSTAAGAGYLFGIPSPAPSTCLYQLQASQKSS